MAVKRRFMVLSVAAVILAPLPSVAADEPPPPDSKPLSAILASAQTRSMGQVAEAEFDHGRWEVTVCRDRTCQKLYIDPTTGAETGRKKTDYERTPSTGSKSIVQIVREVESANLGSITSVDFDHGHWKVELIIG